MEAAGGQQQQQEEGGGGRGLVQAGAAVGVDGGSLLAWWHHTLLVFCIFRYLDSHIKSRYTFPPKLDWMSSILHVKATDLNITSDRSAFYRGGHGHFMEAGTRFAQNLIL